LRLRGCFCAGQRSGGKFLERALISAVGAMSSGGDHWAADDARRVPDETAKALFTANLDHEGSVSNTTRRLQEDGARPHPAMPA
jgi:hypothetical protein